MTNLDMVKLLHDKTGLPLIECKKAADAAGGNVNRAKEILLAYVTEKSKGTTWDAGWLAVKE